MKENIKSTYKSNDTEEWFDKVFTRPIGYMWAVLSVIISGFLSNYLHEQKNTVSVPLRIIEKTTENSLHSFHEIVSTINDDKFCVTAVDTIFEEEEFLLRTVFA